ncbi:MAG: ABC transporter ATP-binding protein [Flavobacteriales bacterium]
MIHTKQIFKSYGDIPVLKGIDLNVKEGEIVSVVGASGAGKTTLLQILGTLERPEKGELNIKGENLIKMNDAKLADFRNRNIGFIFQFHHLLPEFTSLENVCMPGYIAKKDDNEVLERAKELLDYLGLSERMDHKPSQLSGGELQRVAVARALVNKPGIILADEPSGNLDSKNSKELHQLFFDLREKFEQTFVIVTHNEELAEMADRKLTIEDGVI